MTARSAPIPGYWPRALRRTALRVVLLAAVLGVPLLAFGVVFLHVLGRMVTAVGLVAGASACTIGPASLLEYALLPRLGGPDRRLAPQALAGAAAALLVVLGLAAGAAQLAYLAHVGSVELGTREALAAADATRDLDVLAWTVPAGAVVGTVTACRLRGPGTSCLALFALPGALALAGALQSGAYAALVALLAALGLVLLFAACTLADALEQWRWPIVAEERAAASPLWLWGATHRAGGGS